jgi:hypothetical protein
MWTSRAAFQLSWGLVIWGVLALAPAAAQQTQPAQPAQPYGGGTPLDVILHTRLWTDVPDMKPFVKAARPAESSLDYTPTTAKEPTRPPLDTKAQLQQMEDDLENAGAHNEKVAGYKTHHFQATAVKKPNP